MSIHQFARHVQFAVKGIKQSEKIVPANKKKLLGFATYLKTAGKSLPLDSVEPHLFHKEHFF